MNYPLAVPGWDEAELQAIQRVIDRGMYSMGSEVAAFETKFAAFVGTRYAVQVNSGSSANLLMAAALRYRRTNPVPMGSEVIVPAVSWPTTYYPFSQYGYKLKFVDIDRNTFNYDLEALASAITNETRVVVAVNLLGNPNDFTEVFKAIAGRDIILLEDNCESLGAKFDNRMAGTFGLMGTYSSFFSHHIATMEGGVITTDDTELYHILLCLRAHGWTRNLPKKNEVTGVKSDDSFEESFKFVLPGYNLRPIEMEGAIGSVQLDKLPRFLAQRRKNASLFLSLFEGDDRFRVQREVGESSWFGFALIINEETGIKRKELVSRLADFGIESRPVVAGNFAKNPVVKMLPHSIYRELVNADDLDKNGFFVGNNHSDLSEQLETLYNALQAI